MLAFPFIIQLLLSVFWLFNKRFSPNCRSVFIKWLPLALPHLLLTARALNYKAAIKITCTFQTARVFSVAALTVMFPGFTVFDVINPLAIAFAMLPPPIKPTFNSSAILKMNGLRNRAPWYLRPKVKIRSGLWTSFTWITELRRDKV